MIVRSPMAPDGPVQVMFERRKAMKRISFLLSAAALVILLAAPADALQFGRLRETATMVGQGAVELARHRCYPSRCWCNRRGKKWCTRDCRRDRHCKWVWDRKSPCCERWVCKNV